MAKKQKSLKFYDIKKYFHPPFFEVEKELKEQNKTKKDLKQYLKIDESKYNEYLDGKIAISYETSRQLGNFFEISGNFFYKLQEYYNRDKETYSKELKLFNNLKKYISDIIRIQKDSLDIMHDIFNNYKVGNVDELEDKINEQRIMLRPFFHLSKAQEANRHSVSHYGCSVWLQYGENQYNHIPKKIPFNKSVLEDFLSKKENYIKYLRGSKNHKRLLGNFISKMRNFGVFIIDTPNIPKTPYGVARWIDNSPLIQISPKEKYYDRIWFVIFHELGHILKHKDFSERSKAQEDEATNFALNKMFNDSYNPDSDGLYPIEKLTDITESEIEEYSKKYLIDSSFIVSQFMRSTAYKNNKKEYAWLNKKRVSY
ncbi:MAG: hypothetical protein LBQ34_01910 [Alphaproteobacteria bacterium]|jgi:Zn-dependent peptidase ImmA (M78 family)|nr:hypothetical protein [Alphaproteobacteria bacterium]